MPQIVVNLKSKIRFVNKICLKSSKISLQFTVLIQNLKPIVKLLTEKMYYL